MKDFKLLLVAIALAAMVAPAKASDVEGGLAIPFDVNTTTFSAGVPLHVSGQLLAFVHVYLVEASVPLPNQDVDVLVDNVAAKHLQTDGTGSFATDLIFDASQTEHRLRAVAFSGQVLLETSSREILVTIDQFAIGLEVRPSSATIPVGGTVQLSAFATDDNGREKDVTQIAGWSTSDPAVATVDHGLVTGHAAGTATIKAMFAGLVASASVTVT